VAIVLAFGVVGYLRSGGGEDFSVNGGEFEAVFVNGLDVRAKSDAGLVDLSPWSVLLNPIANVIPQQLLPFKKVVYSAWYMETFYSGYKERGGGLAFGAMAEAMVGFGIFGLIVRAGLLGLLFGWIHHRCATRGVGFIGWSFYTWFLIITYDCFRDNAGTILIFLLHMWLPAIAALYATHALLSGAAVAAKRGGLRAEALARLR
jgi:hypothetical protein